MEIQASTGADNWAKGRVLPIRVFAKWWETWTFRLGMIVAIILLGYLGYWLRMSALRRRQKYLELINLHQQKLIDSEIRTQERERKRIASDLHDGIGATLSSIKLQISDVMSDESTQVPTRAKEINDNLTDVIDDIKRIVYDLHPPGLERYGLHSGLKSLVDRLNKTADINVIFDYYGQRDIMQPISITIFRILQELINNTLKHARASEIRIHINEFDGEINIMYEDNGIGMIGSRFTGLGLHSIESRVRSLNGRMTWESNHKGTFYNFDIPF
jgi:signal transduction histidine kinase